jgi:hypothetical protein
MPNLLENPMFMAGMGGLLGSSPSRQPPNFVGNVMQGMMGANQTQQMRRESEMKMRLQEAQANRYQSQTTAGNQQLEMAKQMAATETDPQLRALAQADFPAYLKLKTGAGQSKGNTPIWAKDADGNWAGYRTTPEGIERMQPDEGFNLLPINQDPGVAGAKTQAERDARNESDLEYNPKIIMREEQAKVDSFLLNASSVGDAKALEAYKIQISKADGDAFADAATLKADIESNMPNLEAKMDELRELAPVATYTYLGLGRDWIARQTNLGPGESGVARAKYISIVANEMLPLLKQTFGAAFTAEEGESLKATLGSPNYSPEEKLAVIDSFIRAKSGQIRSLGARTATPATSDDGGWTDL